MMTEIEISCFERIAKPVFDVAGWIVPGIPNAPCLEPDAPASAVLLDVPSRCQVQTYNCGVTATWSILRGLGYKIGLREWNRCCHDAGCSAWEGMDIDQIAKALKTLGLQVRRHRYRGPDHVRRFIDRGQPLLFGQGEDMFEDGDHWMFLYGYSKRHVYVGNVVTPLQSTERWGWKRFRRELHPQELYAINV